MATVARRLPLSRQQTALCERAGELGWAVRRETGDGTRNERLLFSRPGRSLMAVFTHDGAFAYASASGPGTGVIELDLTGTLRELQSTSPRPTPPRSASTGPERPPQTVRGERPEETPPAESSTTAGISVPEPPELRKAWGPWPLLIIGLLVLCVLVFMVARVIA
ncbi:DUF6480 family protein [Kitasatospora sp. DSM 101779]|uniref:DUF6480 family protein n=1 Tax=Kitasatospora sp. DSM 101779 TaxID=2853165 RepID=UPI0021D96257|nr:DUF6480 family protein [Kitasatospora sp. DSM 101779]MCU7826815.1 hypothetical protein [Kitasatospora sp. DSM 101779]